MGTMTILRRAYPRLARGIDRPVGWLSRIGDHTLFYGRALGGTRMRRCIIAARSSG